MERRSDGARLYCIDRHVHTMVNDEGVSLFGYIHAIKLMVRHARTVLLLGGAGGSLANMLSRQDCAVTVVDIDPQARDLAQRHFNLDARIRWVTMEAALYLASSQDRFDAVVVDACDTNGLVRAFAVADRLVAAMAVLKPEAPLIVNLVGPYGATSYAWALARAVAARGLTVTLHSPEEGDEANEILYACRQRSAPAIDAVELQHRPPEVQTYLRSLRAYPVRVASALSESS